MKSLTQKFIRVIALVLTISISTNAQEIGNLYQDGIVFQINEDGTGLVTDLQDLGDMNWYEAKAAANTSTSQSHDDWYLPSFE